jgi:nucleotide-binding universal stress UspA family protein
MSKMKGRFYKILIALDGSEQSMDAANYAIQMAKKEKNDIQLIAIHVLLSQIGYAYTSSDIYTLNTSSSIIELLENIKKEAQKWFDKIKEKVATASDLEEENKIQLKTEVITTDTSIVGAIVEYAERENIDLIVIGTRGRSGFKKLLLGSVASGVVTYATCPVMVVK